MWNEMCTYVKVHGICLEGLNKPTKAHPSHRVVDVSGMIRIRDLSNTSQNLEQACVIVKVFVNYTEVCV
jgi:hypothetical protein